MLTAGSPGGGLGGRGWVRARGGWRASGCGRTPESAGTGVCWQEPVVVPGRGGTGVCVGMLGMEAAGMCVGVLGMEAAGMCVGMPRTVRQRERVRVPGPVEVPELLGIGSCGYTGPADIEVCGYAGQLAVSGSPVRVCQGGKGTTVWEMHDIHLVR